MSFCQYLLHANHLPFLHDVSDDRIHSSHLALNRNDGLLATALERRAVKNDQQTQDQGYEMWLWTPLPITFSPVLRGIARLLSLLIVYRQYIRKRMGMRRREGKEKSHFSNREQTAHAQERYASLSSFHSVKRVHRKELAAPLSPVIYSLEIELESSCGYEDV